METDGVRSSWKWRKQYPVAVIGEQSGTSFLAELKVIRRFSKTEPPRGTGYVVDTLLSARQAMREGTFEDVAKAAIAFGENTDTTAAVACGSAGIKFGIKGSPMRWLQQLHGFDLVQRLLRLLMQRPVGGDIMDDE